MTSSVTLLTEREQVAQQWRDVLLLSSISPPSGVYLMAFDNKLLNMTSKASWLNLTTAPSLHIKFKVMRVLAAKV